jgi:hypothetical protein
MSSESEGDKTTKKLVGIELNNAIDRVVMDGNVSGLRELLETYDDVMERDIHWGKNALQIAVEEGQVDVVEVIDSERS